MDKYLRAMNGGGRKEWSRSAGPMAQLSWLKAGKLTERVPDWFIDFFLKTRDIAAVDSNSDAFGMSSLEENWVIYRLVGESVPTNSLEIGVMRGATTLTISKAIEDHRLTCTQTALDIDPHAVQVVSRKLREAAKAHKFAVLMENSKEWLPHQEGGWQFAFLDGDHAFRTIAFELVETFNRMPVGGWLAMHDIGSVLWGWYQDPGLLMFQALDRELAHLAEMNWLDTSERAQHIQMLFSLGLAPKVASSSNAMVEGWGGVGIVRKIDDSRKLSHAQFAPYAPVPEPRLHQRQPSLSRRIARAAKRLTVG